MRLPHCCRTTVDFPWKLVLVTALFRMLGTMSATLVFPFMPFMLVEFGIPEPEVGTWAGMMASAFFLAQLPSGVFWGWLSDRVGRRPIVAISLCGQAFSLVAIGLSTTAEACLAARMLGGFLCGAEPAIVASLRESTPKQHRTQAFTYSQTGFSGGVLLGPTLGGLLAKPADNIPALRGTVFEASPYLLTCGAAAALQLLGLCFVRLLPRKQRKALGSQEVVELPMVAPETAPPKPRPTAEILSWVRSRAHGVTVGVRATCAHPVIAVCLTDIFLMHVVQSALGELFPLFASNKAHGLGLEPVEIGEAMAPLGLMLGVVSLSFSALEKCVGLKFLFRGGMLLFGSLIFSIPIVLPALKALSRSLLWAGLVTLGLLRPCAGMLSMSAMNIMYNNVLSAHFGLYNGIASSVTSCGRCLSPVTVGSLFAVGVSSAGSASFPLGIYLPFTAAAALAVVAVTISFRLPSEVGVRPETFGATSDELETKRAEGRGSELPEAVPMSDEDPAATLATAVRVSSRDQSTATKGVVGDDGAASSQRPAMAGAGTAGPTMTAEPDGVGDASKRCRLQRHVVFSVVTDELPFRIPSDHV